MKGRSTSGLSRSGSATAASQNADQNSHDSSATPSSALCARTLSLGFNKGLPRVSGSAPHSGSPTCASCPYTALSSGVPRYASDPQP